MRVSAYTATALTLVCLIYHLIKRSSWWFITLHMVIVWCWCAALVLILGFALRVIIGAEEQHHESGYQRRKQLDLVTRPEDDEFFR